VSPGFLLQHSAGFAVQPRLSTSSLALHKLEQEQQDNRAQKSAHEFTQFARRAEAQHPKKEAAQQRADYTHDNISENTEAVTFDDDARQKPGGQSDKNKPEPVFYTRVNVTMPRRKAMTSCADSNALP